MVLLPQHADRIQSAVDRGPANKRVPNRGKGPALKIYIILTSLHSLSSQVYVSP